MWQVTKATGSVASIRRFWITKGMWRKVNEWKGESGRFWKNHLTRKEYGSRNVGSTNLMKRIRLTHKFTLNGQ